MVWEPFWSQGDSGRGNHLIFQVPFQKFPRECVYYNLSCWETCDSSGKPPRNRSQTSLTLSANSTMSPRWRWKKKSTLSSPGFPIFHANLGWSVFIFAKRCIIPTTSAASRRVLGHVRYRLHIQNRIVYAFLHCNLRISDCNPYILLKLHISAIAA